MVTVSLLTKNKDSETALPTLAQTYREHPGLGRKAFIGWSILAAIMTSLYLFFQLAL
jgi:hypothetical protein